VCARVTPFEREQTPEHTWSRKEKSISSDVKGRAINNFAHLATLA
jgi:hypothetical protein